MADDPPRLLDIDVKVKIGFAPVNLVEWISSCKNVTETWVRFPEKPHSLLQRVAARNAVSYKVAAVSGC